MRKVKFIALCLALGVCSGLYAVESAHALVPPYYLDHVDVDHPWGGDEDPPPGAQLTPITRVPQKNSWIERSGFYQWLESSLAQIGIFGAVPYRYVGIHVTTSRAVIQSPTGSSGASPSSTKTGGN